jgi:predicted kinase
MRLILTIGPPCSGKSTYSKQKELEGFIRISQDEQGIKQHFNNFLKALSENKDIIIDRMNFNIKQRRKYIDIAKVVGYSIHIIEFLIDDETCLQRGKERKNHPSIKDLDTLIEVLKFFRKNYQSPKEYEYDTMEIIG